MNPDLATRYLGLELKNPIIVGSCSLTGQIDSLRQLEDAGSAAVVLPPLFEEQIEHEEQAIHHVHEYHTESTGESLDFFPELDSYNTGTESYLELVGDAKAALSIPVIASIDADSQGGWTHYARLLAEAGADAIELNVNVVPTATKFTGAEIEKSCAEIISSIRDVVSIPLAARIGAHFSAIPNAAHQLVGAGADGLTLFSRFLEPDIDLETLKVVPRLAPSSSDHIHLPLRWIAILRGDIDASLAAAGGFRETPDVIKALLAGADAVVMASAIVDHGAPYIATVLAELEAWLTEKEYQGIEQMKGSVSRLNCADPSAYERLNYLKALVSYTGKFI